MVAMKKTVEVGNTGAEATHFEILSQALFVTVGGFMTPEARQAGKAPILSMNYILNVRELGCEPKDATPEIIAKAIAAIKGDAQNPNILEGAEVVDSVEPLVQQNRAARHAAKAPKAGKPVRRGARA